MSLNRENIIWQSGAEWYIGFFDYSVWGEDHEWDVDYDFSRFQWASGPHPSQEEARGAWQGANPGCYTTATDKDSAQEYDKMFRAYRDSEPVKAQHF